MRGKLSNETSSQTLFDDSSANLIPTKPMQFSAEAKAVFDAGRELWKYYHEQENANPNASFYDIHRHFQGVRILSNGKERMNNDSKDEKCNSLIKVLRDRIKVLAKKIEPKVYENGFLK